MSDTKQGLLNDKEITELCHPSRPMITPFLRGQIREDDGKKLLSYGLSSFGYDIRAGQHYRIFTNANAAIVDPKEFQTMSFVSVEASFGDVIIIPPNSFILTYSEEYFDIPEDVAAIVLSKSTYARCGVQCLATPLEPGWKGHVTLEFANTTPLPARFYPGEGCAQVMFFRGRRPDITYADRGGKYMDQGPEVVLPRI